MFLAASYINRIILYGPLLRVYILVFLSKTEWKSRVGSKENGIEQAIWMSQNDLTQHNLARYFGIILTLR